jgi:hypothetical protein
LRLRGLVSFFSVASALSAAAALDGRPGRRGFFGSGGAAVSAGSSQVSVNDEGGSFSATAASTGWGVGFSAAPLALFVAVFARRARSSVSAARGGCVFSASSTKSTRRALLMPAGILTP